MKKELRLIIAICSIVGICFITVFFCFFNAHKSSQVYVVYPDSEWSLSSFECSKKPYCTIGVSPAERYDSFIASDDVRAERYYQYTAPAAVNGNSYVNMDDDAWTDTWTAKMIGEHYMVTSFKEDGLHSYKLDKHILDQLLYCNGETACTEVVFEAYGRHRILYGNNSMVILYNGEKDAVQYISLPDRQILNEQELTLKKKYHSYNICVNIQNATIDILGVSFWGTIIDVLGTGFSNESFSLPLLEYNKG